MTIAEKEAPPSGGSEDGQPETDKPSANPENNPPAAGNIEKPTDARLRMNSKIRIFWKGSRVVMKWGAAPGADSYEIWMAYCGEGDFKKVKTVRNLKAVFKKLNGKKLNKKRCVRAYVIAYQNGTEIGRSMVVHSAGPKSAFTNVKKITTSKKTYKLNVGKKAKMKAKAIKNISGRRLLSKNHCPRLRYASSDVSVATVSEKGKITAVGAGMCNVWVYAQNGVSRKVTVIVE